MPDLPPPNSAFSDTRRWSWARGAVYAIIIGAAGSAVWDLIAKPGLGRVSRATLALFGSLSATVRDTPYSSAALDPSPLPALILLIALMATVAGAFSYTIRRMFAPRTPAAADRGFRIPQWVVAVALAASVVWGFVAVAVVNKAVLVRRVFEANLAIASPVLQVEEAARLRARFAGMSNREDYRGIDRDMRAVAAKHNLVLRWEHVE